MKPYRLVSGQMIPRKRRKTRIVTIGWRFDPNAGTTQLFLNGNPLLGQADLDRQITKLKYLSFLYASTTGDTP